MKNGKISQSSQPEWEYKKRSAALKKDGKTILSLEFDKKNKAELIIDKNEYSLANKGFWHPVTIIEKKNKPIVVLARKSWDSKAFVHIADGNIYEVKLKNAPIITLMFSNGDGNELFSYRSSPDGKHDVQLIMGSIDVPATDLHFLLALGLFSFKGILGETTITKTTKPVKAAKTKSANGKLEKNKSDKTKSENGQHEKSKSVKTKLENSKPQKPGSVKTKPVNGKAAKSKMIKATSENGKLANSKPEKTSQKKTKTKKSRVQKAIEAS